MITSLWNWFSAGGGAHSVFPSIYMLRQVQPQLYCCPLSLHCCYSGVSAGFAPCLEAALAAAAAVAVVEAAVRWPLHPSPLHCQSISSQTIATGEKKC